MTNINANNVPASIILQAFIGQLGYQNYQSLINYTNNQNINAAAQGSTVINLAGMASYQAYNLATYFPLFANTQFIVVYDDTATGQPFSISTAAASGNVPIAASGFWAYTTNGGTPPIIYLTNPNTTASVIGIAAFSL